MSKSGAVLIASRDGMFLAMVQGVGNDLGYLIVPTPTVACAVDAFCGGNVRVAVVDEQLADGTGEELLKRIRRMSPEAKVIFIMEEPSEELEREVRRVGVSYCGCKPVEPGLFNRVLEKVYEHETHRMLRVGA